MDRQSSISVAICDVACSVGEFWVRDNLRSGVLTICQNKPVGTSVE